MVDPALNPQLADQTLAACLIILGLTNWDVRILSKGNFLRRIAEALPEQFHDRVIFGHNRVGSAFCGEVGPPARIL